jgi:hypothetical protein
MLTYSHEWHIFLAYKIIKFINQLYNTYYLAHGILYRHTEDCFMAEVGALVHVRIEAQVLVSVQDIYSLSRKWKR